jgi:hypothetical protein
MKLRSIKKLSENQGNLLPNDSGAVILNADLEPIGSCRFDVHPDLRDNPCLFARIEGIVDSLFHRRQQRLPRIIKAQEMPILGEKFTNGYITLLRSHCLCCDAPARIRARWDVIFSHGRPDFGLDRGQVWSSGNGLFTYTVTNIKGFEEVVEI